MILNIRFQTSNLATYTGKLITCLIKQYVINKLIYFYAIQQTTKAKQIQQGLYYLDNRLQIEFITN